MYVDIKNQLEGILDEAIDRGENPLEVLDVCQSAIIDSLKTRNKVVPEKLSQIRIF